MPISAILHPARLTRRHQSLAFKTRVIAAFEAEGCEVIEADGERDTLRVEMPSWESKLHGSHSHVPIASSLSQMLTHGFKDELEVTFAPDGEQAMLRFVYWNWAHVLIHGLVATLFAMEYCVGQSGWNAMETIAYATLASLLPLAGWLVTVVRFRATVLARVMGEV